MWLAFATFGNPRDIIWLNTRKKNWEKSQTFVEEKDAIWIIFYENVHITLTLDHRKDFIKTLKLAIWPPNAWCMLHVVEVLKKKKEKNPGDQSIFIMGGGGGWKRIWRGDQRVFRRNRRRIKRHQQSIKLGAIENWLQVNRHWGGILSWHRQNPPAPKG